MCSFSLQIDFLVNNAGILQLGLSLETDLDMDVSVMNINVLGTISLTKAVLPHMVQNKSGQIVVLSSASGKCGKLTLFWAGLAKSTIQATRTSRFASPCGKVLFIFTCPMGSRALRQVFCQLNKKKL